MENTTLITISRLDTLRRQMGTIANNIANMNTPAYKSEKMMFIDHLVKSREDKSFAPTQLSFVRDVASYRDTADGAMEFTGNPIDVAINGKGYFSIDTPQGERYTRSGHFKIDGEGQLVTTNGNPVLSDAGQPFFFGPNDGEISISRDGTLSTQNGPMGRLAIVTFDNEQELIQIGGGIYRSQTPPTPHDTPMVEQGYLEGSNVNAIGEMSRMIEVNRAYGGVQKFIEAENERQKKVLELMLPAR